MKVEPCRSRFGHWLAVEDQPGCAFEPDYRGSAEDMVPAGFEDFTPYIGGNDVEDFPSDTAEPAGAAAPHRFTFPTVYLAQ